MIDTILIYLDNQVEGVASFREKYKNDRNPRLLEHLEITILPNSIRIMGSLAKYIAWTNYYTPSHKDIREALVEIGERLNIDIMQGVVRRIDIAHNFRLSKPAELYLLEIWSCPHTLIDIYRGNTILLRNYVVALNFYNKIKDMVEKKKKNFVGTFDEDEYVLRYELQLRKNIARKFGLKTITVNMLLDEKFYLSLIDMWLKYFSKVKTIASVADNSHHWINSKEMTPKQLIDHLAVIGFHTLTSKEKRIILSSTKENRDHNAPGRIINKLNFLSKKEIVNESGKDLWSELDKKVHQFYKVQRSKLI